MDSSAPTANARLFGAKDTERTRNRYMTASEKQADGPAYGNTFMIKTRCLGLSGLGKAKTSVMSVTGSATARGPEMWSDMSLYPLLSRRIVDATWKQSAPTG